MTRTRRCKCRHCAQLYDPDPRNRYHQRYCRQPACRRASKSASQRRWRTSPKGKNYFRGPANRQRVKAWQRAHPGYWRKRRQSRRAGTRALQDHCPPQVLVPEGDKSTLPPRALQDVIRTQGLALTGLVAQLTGSALQENIASTTRRLIRLGQQIQGPHRRRLADDLRRYAGDGPIHTDDRPILDYMTHASPYKNTLSVNLREMLQQRSNAAEFVSRWPDDTPPEEAIGKWNRWYAAARHLMEGFAWLMDENADRLAQMEVSYRAAVECVPEDTQTRALLENLPGYQRSGD